MSNDTPDDRLLQIRVNCSGSWARLVKIRESDLPAGKLVLRELARLHHGEIKFGVSTNGVTKPITLDTTS